MNDNNNSGTAAGGIGIVTVIQLVFFILKLCGVIAWPWVIVFLPYIIAAGLVALVILVSVITIIIAYIMKGRN